jgi:hypothetical protein
VWTFAYHFSRKQVGHLTFTALNDSTIPAFSRPRRAHEIERRGRASQIGVRAASTRDSHACFREQPALSRPCRRGDRVGLTSYFHYWHSSDVAVVARGCALRWRGSMTSLRRSGQRALFERRHGRDGRYAAARWRSACRPLADSVAKVVNAVSISSWSFQDQSICGPQELLYSPARRQDNLRGKLKNQDRIV